VGQNATAWTVYYIYIREDEKAPKTRASLLWTILIKTDRMDHCFTSSHIPRIPTAAYMCSYVYTVFLSPSLQVTALSPCLYVYTHAFAADAVRRTSRIKLPRRHKSLSNEDFFHRVALCVLVYASMR
jgi:hypothetical protein